MIVVNLQGGLGNQMFQYAAAKGVAKKGETIYLDHRQLEQNNADSEHFTARSYELGIFKNINAQRAGEYQFKILNSQGLFFKALRCFFKADVIYQQENEYITFSDRPKAAFRYLNGYFQSEKYFMHIRRQLLQDFSFPLLDADNETIKKQIINTDNSVSVHIRRGDYLKSAAILEVHGVLTFNYYQTAVQALLSKYPDLTIFVFSDDIAWCRANLDFPGITIQYIYGNKSKDSWKDMALMSLCKHHVIANSSFSWWGAWLSKNAGDTLAPACWLNPIKVNFNIQDIIPADWTILDVE